MTNSYYLFTGGHSGLGLGVVRRLLVPGNRIGLIVRNEARATEAKTALQDHPLELVDSIDFFYADLADRSQVDRVVEEILARWPQVDRLFNNAAVLSPSGPLRSRKTHPQFEVNTVAAYRLTVGLESLVKKSSDPRVVTTVTAGMSKRRLRLNRLLNPSFRNDMGVYVQSKQAVMLLMEELSRQWPEVDFVSVNPGANKTKMTTGSATPGFVKVLARLFFSDPKVGTQRIYDAAFDARFAGLHDASVSNDRVVPTRVPLSGADRETLIARIEGDAAG